MNGTGPFPLGRVDLRLPARLLTSHWRSLTRLDVRTGVGRALLGLCGALVVLCALIDEGEIPRSPRSFGVERGGEQGEAPDPIFAPAESVARAANGHQGRTVAVDLDTRDAGKISAQAIEPTTFAGINGEDVGAIGGIAERPIRFRSLGAVCLWKMSRNGSKGLAAHVADSVAGVLSAGLEVGKGPLRCPAIHGHDDSQVGTLGGSVARKTQPGQRCESQQQGHSQ
jgi:hypothetical protein